MPAITTVSPNGGETWRTKTIQAISWATVNVSGNVDVYLYKGFVQYKTIASGITNNGEYAWGIDSTIADANDYTIRIQSSLNPNIYDESDAPFTVTSQMTLLGKNNCESLTGITTKSYGSSSLAYWQIGSGYVGNGYACPNTSGGYIQFSANYSKSSIMMFWIHNGGYPSSWTGTMPIVTIDGVSIDVSIKTEVGPVWDRWNQIETKNIPAGAHIIKIDSYSYEFASIYIDEIEFWN
jgi:hypothetical protein